MVNEQPRPLTSVPTRRLRACVENWPDCYDGGYNPYCCRFPKSCSCEGYDPATITEDRLEDVAVSEPGVESLVEQLPDISAADFLIELRRIADALERGSKCNERNGTATCGLSDRHVGYHVTADGKVHWLDED